MKNQGWLPASLIDKLVVQAWNDGYQAALAQCETAVYQGMPALQQLLSEGRKE